MRLTRAAEFRRRCNRRWKYERHRILRDQKQDRNVAEMNKTKYALEMCTSNNSHALQCLERSHVSASFPVIHAPKRAEIRRKQPHLHSATKKNGTEINVPIQLFGASYRLADPGTPDSQTISPKTSQAYDVAGTYR